MGGSDRPTPTRIPPTTVVDSLLPRRSKKKIGGGPHADCTRGKGRGKDWHCGLREEEPEEEAGIDRQSGFTYCFLLSPLIIAVRVFCVFGKQDRRKLHSFS